MMMKWYLSFVFVTCWSYVSSSIVQTTHGPVKGKTIQLFSGKKVDAFLGVPFADPPTGRNRFAPPQPLRPWNETLQAKILPKSCVQVVPKSFRKTAWYVSESEENEDCLYLNVWVPQSEKKRSKAIMIWIHGGLYLSGSSNMPLYDGSILASENDVIVASLNYRLGAFGFLYLNSTEVPGNAGLRDQIQAITWIKTNADRFGGDPEKITLFGESSGSMSISMHVVNTKLKDLFRNGIMESGSLLSARVTTSEADLLSSSISLIKKMHCPVDNLDDTLKCLRDKPTRDIVNGEPFPFYLKFVYLPVRNGIEVPVDVLAGVQRVPLKERKNLIVGNIPKEIAYFLSSFLPDKILNDNTTISEDDLRTIIKNVLEVTDVRIQDIILHEYKHFDGTNKRNQLRNEYGNLVTDIAMLCPALEFTQKWVLGHNHLYQYYFTHRPSKVGKLPLPEWLGPTHGDDIPFVFGQPLDPRNGYTDAEKDLSKRIMTLWTNFANTGNPNSMSREDVLWPYVKPNGNLTHLVLDLNLSVSNYLRGRECSFVNDILPSLLTMQGQLDSLSSSNKRNKTM